MYGPYMQDLRKRWQLILLLILPFFVFQSRQDVRTRGWHCPDWVGCDGPKHHSQHVSCSPDPTTKFEFNFTNFSNNQNGESSLLIFCSCFLSKKSENSWKSVKNEIWNSLLHLLNLFRNDNGFVVCAYNRSTDKVDHFLENEAKGTKVVGAHSLEEMVRK